MRHSQQSSGHGHSSARESFPFSPHPLFCLKELHDDFSPRDFENMGIFLTITIFMCLNLSCSQNGKTWKW